MRIKLGGLAAILVLSLSVSGCAASMGTVAGDVIGGAAWGAMKTGKVAWKGGSFAAKTAGRTVAGAARGVHEEFSPKDEGDAAPGGSTTADDAALGNRAKDTGPVASAQGQRATLAD